MKKSNNIFKGNFFEKGGISNQSPFIIFVVFLIILQIGISFKSIDVIIETNEINKEIFDLGRQSISLKTKLMGFYKRSVIEQKVKDFDLETSGKLPFVLEKK
ncbi:MAG: FtsL-like putative cell division protein [Flavobacteriales bacterium]